MLHTPLKRSASAGSGLLAVRPRFDAFSLMELLVVIVIIAALAALVTSNVGRTTDDAEAVAARATLQTIAEGFNGSSAAPGYVADMKHVPGFRHADVRIHDLLSSSSYPAVDRFDPIAQRGWRGPYLRNDQGVRNTNPARNGAFPASDERRTPDEPTFLDRNFFTGSDWSPYGIPGDLAVADPWGNPIVLQIPPESAFSNSAAGTKRFRYARLVSAGADGIIATPRDRLAGLVVLPDGGIDTSARSDDLVLFLNRADTHEPEES
jgi:prepilin-type N-terminal cleavage/methylation domain-containing protein